MLSKFYHINIDWKDTGAIASSNDVNETLGDEAVDLFFVRSSWQPEHAFITAICSSVGNSFLRSGRMVNLSLREFSIKGSGRVERRRGRNAVTEVSLIASIEVASDRDAEVAEVILQRAVDECLICNSINTKLCLKPFIEIAVPV